jgi:plastocyanin
MTFRTLASLCTVFVASCTAYGASAPHAGYQVLIAGTDQSAAGNGAEFVNNDESAVTVSQKEKAFEPAAAEIRVGQSVEIVNDDSTVHNVFCQSAEFKYNSGPQQPGNRAKIKFTTAGTFEIRCAIHPKMKLVVTVSP